MKSWYKNLENKKFNTSFKTAIHSLKTATFTSALKNRLKILTCMPIAAKTYKMDL